MDLRKYSHDALVMLGHGWTQHEDSGAPVYQHAAELRRRGIFAEVREAFWKQLPQVKHVLAEIAAPRVFIVPLLISEGYFCNQVIPRELGFTTGQSTVSRPPHEVDVDAEVADCDAALPERFLRHAWAAVQQEKSPAARERIDKLVIRLANILRADYARSEAALAQPVQQASFGAAHQRMFNFESMSKLLSRVGRRGGLGERRRRRVEESLAALKAQRFFAGPDAAGVHRFEFATADAALAAFRERLAELAGLLKGLQVAELEVEGSYVEDLHDAVFAAFDAQSDTPQDLEFFPDYLVCLEAGQPGSQGSLAEALSSGSPSRSSTATACSSTSRRATASP